jgi:hypothetical protein
MPRHADKRRYSPGGGLVLAVYTCLLLPPGPALALALAQDQPNPQIEELRRQLQIERAARKSLTYQSALAWSPDGRRLAAGFSQGKVSIYNPPKDRSELRIVNTGTASFFEWSPNGKQFAFSTQGEVRIGSVPPSERPIRLGSTVAAAECREPEPRRQTPRLGRVQRRDLEHRGITGRIPTGRAQYTGARRGVEPGRAPGAQPQRSFQCLLKEF